ncbi:hypothetical protein Anapl_03409 [Anas platyrhynchos]|uniref:Uncharacterized protein n=1 Tax=Anas platyrhynchos TaxID=8839 RepID=R0M1A8_ANAPL|nr:hypothetical protein Anapl_03409 [Anas platyrhynchos]
MQAAGCSDLLQNLLAQNLLAHTACSQQLSKRDQSSNGSDKPEGGDRRIQVRNDGEGKPPLPGSSKLSDWLSHLLQHHTDFNPVSDHPRQVREKEQRRRSIAHKRSLRKHRSSARAPIPVPGSDDLTERRVCTTLSKSRQLSTKPHSSAFTSALLTPRSPGPKSGAVLKLHDQLLTNWRRIRHKLGLSSVC